MAKDYAKFVPPKSRSTQQSSGRWGVILFASLILILSVAISFFIYEKRASKTPGEKPSISGFLSYAASSVFHHHPSAVAAPAKNKAPKPNAEPKEVQFDFYNQLPDMQMSVTGDDQSNTENVKVVASADKLLPAEPESTPAAPPEVASTKQVVVKEEVVNQAQPSQVAKVADPAPVAHPKVESLFDENEVTKQLSEEDSRFAAPPVQDAAPKGVSGKQYVLQLGSFESKAGAERLQAALSAGGFKTQVIEKKQENKVSYRVEQGPFESKSIAKSSQQRLQQRGFESVIRESL